MVSVLRYVWKLSVYYYYYYYYSLNMSSQYILEMFIVQASGRWGEVGGQMSGRWPSPPAILQVPAVDVMSSVRATASLDDRWRSRIHSQRETERELSSPGRRRN